MYASDGGGSHGTLGKCMKYGRLFEFYTIQIMQIMQIKDKSCKWEGVKLFQNFAYILYGRPLMSWHNRIYLEIKRGPLFCARDGLPDAGDLPGKVEEGHHAAPHVFGADDVLVDVAREVED